MQKDLAKPTAKSLRLSQEILDELRDTKDLQIIMQPIPLKGLVLASFDDSSFGDKPVAGHVLLATTPQLLDSVPAVVSLLDWRSHRIQQAVGSTLAAETQAVRAGIGAAQWARKMFMAILHQDLSLIHISEPTSPY